MTLRPGRRGSSGGDSTIEMMPPAFNMRDEDTHKEVYASPDDHYLGSPNNKPHPPLPENYPEMAAPAGLEPVQPEETKFGGVYYNKFQDDSPIPISAIPASFAAPSDAPDGNASKPPAKKPWHQNWTIRILIIALAIVIIVAIIVGAVVGTRASGNNDSSSGNDDNSTANNTGTDTETTATATETGTATTTSSSPSSTSTNPYEEPEPEDIEMGVSYNATFTMYGTGDGSGGSNCNTRQNACGLFTEPGFSVGVSRNLFGSSSGDQDPPMCGTCWFLETFVDSSGYSFRHNITALVTNECNGDEGEVCGMRSLDDTNDWDSNVNFNLCIDSGARDALFDDDPEIGLAVGRATRVSCDDWEGEVIE